MSVSRLTADGDWRFGRSLEDYARNSDEVAQNVLTRVKFLVNDWFLAVEEGIDWYGILGSRNNRKAVESEVRRTVLETEGVTALNELSVEFIDVDNLEVRLTYSDIFASNLTTVITFRAVEVALSVDGEATVDVPFTVNVAFSASVTDLRLEQFTSEGLVLSQLAQQSATTYTVQAVADSPGIKTVTLSGGGFSGTLSLIARAISGVMLLPAILGAAPVASSVFRIITGV